MKMVGLGFALYLQDYDERFPWQTSWVDATLPNVIKIDHYRCVEVAKEKPAAFGYAYNSQLSRQEQTKIAQPETVPMVFDSWKLEKNAHDPFTSLANPPRHNGGNNIGYADNHVKWVQMEGVSH